ncbi:MAG: ATP-binding cassette domain-containing protein [candidate division Zixibacteria bacterium]|nr:ATP-binding cassette domain-containing protein [candidate division Zixibacteria bacterium]
MAILEVDKLNYRLSDRRFLIENLSFEIGPSNGLMVSGPTGSGKTTLTKILLGLKPGYDGSIRFEDHLKLIPGKARTTAFRRRIGFMLEEPLVFDKYNLMQNIQVYLKLAKIRVDKNTIRDRLYDIGLGGMNRKPISSLSWGQTRAVEMLRIVLKSPRLVICDQPFAALDNEKKIWMKNCLNALVNSGSAVIFTFSLAEVGEMFNWPRISLKE